MNTRFRNLVGLSAVMATLVATPTLAADRKVPANATGALSQFKGQMWIEPLGFCTALHVARAQNAKKAGDSAGVESARLSGAAFRMAAAERAAADRGVSFDEGLTAIEPYVNRGYSMVIAIGAAESYQVADWVSRCDEILRAAEKLG